MEHKNDYLMSMAKLINELFKHDIPWNFKTLFSGGRIGIMKDKTDDNEYMDIVCHEYSMGGNEGLYEIMSGLTEEEGEVGDVLGYLSLEEVMRRVLYCWRNQTSVYKKSSTRAKGWIYKGTTYFSIGALIYLLIQDGHIDSYYTWLDKHYRASEIISVIDTNEFVEDFSTRVYDEWTKWRQSQFDILLNSNTSIIQEIEE